jgi:hypothetical protein
MDTPDGITISRDGQQYGPYTLDQANTYLLAGNLLPGDLAWDTQKSAWVPLTQIAGIKFSAPPPPAPRVRNTFVLVLMAIAWWIVMMFIGFILVGVLAGFMAGLSHPENGAEAGREAGREAGQIFGLPILLGSLALSIWLTVIGKLPGTRK